VLAAGSLWIAAINVGMLALLVALQEISPAEDRLAAGTLGQQLIRWGRKTGADPSARPAVLGLGVLLWSRVHGLVSLELGGAFESMGIDGELLLTSELEAVTRNGLLTNLSPCAQHPKNHNYEAGPNPRPGGQTIQLCAANASARSVLPTRQIGGYLKSPAKSAIGQGFCGGTCRRRTVRVRRETLRAAARRGYTQVT
jgi:hypothetical protein